MDALKCSHASCRLTDQRSMAGTAPTDFQFTRALNAGPVHCSVWLSRCRSWPVRLVRGQGLPRGGPPQHHPGRDGAERGEQGEQRWLRDIHSERIRRRSGSPGPTIQRGRTSIPLMKNAEHPNPCAPLYPRVPQLVTRNARLLGDDLHHRLMCILWGRGRHNLLFNRPAAQINRPVET
jgi:hypothetical protein